MEGGVACMLDRPSLDVLGTALGILRPTGLKVPLPSGITLILLLSSILLNLLSSPLILSSSSIPFYFFWNFSSSFRVSQLDVNQVSNRSWKLFADQLSLQQQPQIRESRINPFLNGLGQLVPHRSTLTAVNADRFRRPI